MCDKNVTFFTRACLLAHCFFTFSLSLSVCLSVSLCQTCLSLVYSHVHSLTLCSQFISIDAFQSVRSKNIDFYCDVSNSHTGKCFYCVGVQFRLISTYLLDTCKSKCYASNTRWSNKKSHALSCWCCCCCCWYLTRYSKCIWMKRFQINNQETTKSWRKKN